MYNKLAAKQLLSPFQIIITLIFLTPSLTTSLIQILMQISLLFVVVCFINNFLKNNLNLTIFIKQVVKFKIKRTNKL